MVPNIDKICFVNSEACMSAIRLARGYKEIKSSNLRVVTTDIPILLIQAGSGAITFGSPIALVLPRNGCGYLASAIQ
jgi:glutamate-1-semialdehyde aminotransferase